MQQTLCNIIAVLSTVTAFSEKASADPAHLPPALPMGHWIQARKALSTAALVRDLGGEYRHEGRHERITFTGKRLTTPDLLELGRSPHVRSFLWNGGSGLEPDGMTAFAGMPELETLLLWSVGTVTDDSLVHLAGCRKLQVLNLGANGRAFTGAGLRHLAGCSALRHLTLNSLGGLQDAELRHLAQLRSLQTLMLSDCPQLTDAAVSDLLALPALQELFVVRTKISEAGLLKLAGLKKLQKLGVSPAQLSPAGAKTLQLALPKLEIVYSKD